MKKLLIIGDTGFIGKNIIAHSQITSEFEVFKSSDIETHKFDITNYENIYDLINNIQPDLVVNLAGITDISQPLEKLIAVNGIALAHLVNVLKQLNFKGRLLTMSSGYVYSLKSLNKGQVAETDDTNPPINYYGISKKIAEDICLQNLENCNFEIVICRIFNTIGLYQAEKFLIPKLVKAFKEKQEVLEVGNTDIYRDFIDVRDICNMIYILLNNNEISQENSKYSIINLCNGIGISIKTVLQILEKISNHTPQYKVNNAFIRTNDPAYFGDNNLLKSLGYKQQYSIEETLKYLYENS